MKRAHGKQMDGDYKLRIKNAELRMKMQEPPPNLPRNRDKLS